MSRCTGHCCKSFPLGGSTPEQWRDPAFAARAQDGAIIADMLVPLGKRENRAGEVWDFYTCRHHDTTTGDCLNYEGRPRLCSEFPYGKPCEVQGCTLDLAANAR